MARRKKTETVENTAKIYFDDEVLKCECLKAFTDKYTDKLYEVGKIYEFTFKRIKEIKNKNEKLIKIID